MDENRAEIIKAIVEFIDSSNEQTKEWNISGDGLDNYVNFPGESNEFYNICDLYDNLGDDHKFKIIKNLLLNNPEFKITENDIADILSNLELYPEVYHSYYVGHIYNNDNKVFIASYEFGEFENQIEINKEDNLEFHDFLISANDEELTEICNSVDECLNFSSFKDSIERYKKDMQYFLNFESYIYMGSSGVALTVAMDEFIDKIQENINYRNDMDIDIEKLYTEEIKDNEDE